MAYCDPCEHFFRHWSSYRQHLKDSPFHHYCDDCSEDFDSSNKLEQHYIQSRKHHYCRKCATHFENRDELTLHCTDNHFYCERCDKFLPSANGVRQHKRQSHFYCDVCQHYFLSDSNLRAHLRSGTHRPKNVPCAFRYLGCMQPFVSKSAMILHLEVGTCPSGADRRMIDRWVRRNDRDNVITVPQQHRTGPVYRNDDIESIATEQSWNGDAYECVLCHEPFGTLVALNSHLASPKHQERIYRCPLETCHMRFTTLSGLCQHVESETCGVSRFRTAREGIDRLLRDLGRMRIQASS